MVSQGGVFPGRVEIPPLDSGKEKEMRVQAAMESARLQERDPDTIWTDGSRLASGGVGGGVTWYGRSRSIGGRTPSQ